MSNHHDHLIDQHLSVSKHHIDHMPADDLKREVTRRMSESLGLTCYKTAEVTERDNPEQNERIYTAEIHVLSPEQFKIYTANVKHELLIYLSEMLAEVRDAGMDVDAEVVFRAMTICHKRVIQGDL